MANEAINNIPCRLQNIAVDGHVAGTSDIIDDELGKSQAQINTEIVAAEQNLDNRLGVVEQLAEISIGGGDAQIATGSDFNNPTTAQRAKVTTVGSILDGADEVPTAGSNNLVKSGGVYNSFAQLDKDIVNIETIGNIVKTDTAVSVEQTGKMVSYNGSVTTSANFNISAPIHLNKGDSIIVNAAGYTTTGVIAKVLPSGSQPPYYTLVKGTSTTPLTAHLYSYIASEECDIVITSYVNAFPTNAIVSNSQTINDIENSISKNSNEIAKIGKATAIPITPIRGGWYNTYGNGSVGSIATLVYTSNRDWASINMLANGGDVFYITGHGGNSPRLWAFVDSTTNEILAFSAADYTGNLERIVAPKDCRVVINIHILTVQPFGVWKEQADFGGILNVENYSMLPTLPQNPLKKITYFDGFAGIIHHWGFVGDSLMSGFFDNTGLSNYDYSWGQRMCRKLGVNGYNFSRGGQTTKGWIEEATSSDDNIRNRSWGGAKTNLKQAYVIGLGVNDKTQSYGVGDVSTDVGTYDPTTDTDTNASTFAGYYAGIIQRLRSVQPNAPIFLVTMPNQGTWQSVVPYNDVIKDFEDIFTNIYIIDIYDKMPIFDVYYYELPKIWDGGHLSPLGYEYIASVMMQYIDWLIRNNYSAFEDINTIPYTDNNS